MKILIVDDEERTLTGLTTQIDWKGLGFESVLLASDGMEGLDSALRHRPDILLCDVRMPRLDGIEMVRRLQGSLPGLVPIFMSGYSDKEYLKAAIRLRAVSYVEKPIDEKELVEAVEEAIALSRKMQKLSSEEMILSRQAEQELVRLCLSAPSEGAREKMLSLLSQLGYPAQQPEASTCFLLKAQAEADALPAPERVKALLLDALPQKRRLLIQDRHREQIQIYFLFTQTPLSPGILARLRETLQGAYQEVSPLFFSQGKANLPFFEAYKSYTSAIIRLQNAYFFPEGSFLYEEGDREYPDLPLQESQLPEDPAGIEALFQAALASLDQKEGEALLENLSLRYNANRNAIPSQVLDLYYNLEKRLKRSYQREGVAGGDFFEGLMQEVQRHFSFASLHADLARKTAYFYQATQHAAPESSVIRQIKGFMESSYPDAALSVKDIGDHVGLSASYVCTVFKNETGQTLNQYLTTLRMEKAKLLLADPSIRIGEISAQVGYLDGSYFGKSFKRYTGYSPSEYRDHFQEGEA